MTCSRFLTLVAVLASTSLPFAHAQNGAPCPSSPVGDHGQSMGGKALASPAAVAETRLGGKALTIHYNAPSARCRTVMGGVVPYGQVWRTGANPATSFTTEAALVLNDKLQVPAGSYTLYTLPAAPGTPWLLIVNKETGQWGTVYHGAKDLGRVPMHGAKLDAEQELMSLSFDHTTGMGTQLHMRWEKTDEWVDIRLAK